MNKFTKILQNLYKTFTECVENYGNICKICTKYLHNFSPQDLIAYQTFWKLGKILEVINSILHY